jgi:hypothetical protein
MTRLAIVKGDVETIKRYLPTNYYVSTRRGDAVLAAEGEVLIEGNDSAGWTLDRYVLPRLASGLIFGYEVTQAGDRIYRCSCCTNAFLTPSNTRGECEWCEDEHHDSTVTH